MIYTKAKMREFARNLDNRLENDTAYTDTWLDDRIEEGIALAQDIKQTLFYTKEKYDIEANLTVDMLGVVEIIPQREVHTIWAVEYDTASMTVEVTANNHVILRRIEDAPLPEDYTVTIRYFFYHTLPFIEIEMSMEVYKMVKHCIAVACFQWLQDQESEQYHTAIAESMVVKSTFDIEKDLMEIPEDRLWRASWA
jgi:hypothetical protein